MSILRFAPLLFVFSAAGALAQDDGAPANEPPPMLPGEESASAPPAQLFPDEPAPVEPAPMEPSVTAPTTSVVPAAPAVMGERAPGAVEVGTLGTLEGPVAGTLSDADGGLGSQEWNRVGRAEAEAALTALPPPASPTARLLLRKLLLTVAPPPAGQAEAPFNAVRIGVLLRAGLLNDAASVAAQVRAPKDPETSRAQADALLFAGNDTDACGDATAFRLESDEQFWIELRAYCYALAKDPALDLTRAVLGTSDPAFSALLDGIVSGRARATVAFAGPASLHVRMMQRLRQPMNEQIANLGTPGAFIAAQSGATPKPIRIAAAEKALRAGALAPASVAQVLDFVSFKPEDLTAAPAMARSDPLIVGLARLRAALKRETDPTNRAELLYTAFRIGEEQRLSYQVAPLFAEDAAALVPQPDWANWATTFARGLLIAGKPAAAQRWLNVVRGSPISPDDLTIAFALVLRDDVYVQQSQAALTGLAQRTLADPEGSSPRAALVFGLFDALGMPMPPEAQANVQGLVAHRWPGRRPSDAAMRRLEDASVHDRRGETVLGVISAIGRGPGDLAPDVTVRLVRALQTIGVHDGAHMLAAETVLTR